MVNRRICCEKSKKKNEKFKDPFGRICQGYCLFAGNRPNSSQPRRDFDVESIVKLADSIRRYGILQPLSVRRIPAQREVARTGDLPFAAEDKVACSPSPASENGGVARSACEVEAHRKSIVADLLSATVVEAETEAESGAEGRAEVGADACDGTEADCSSSGALTLLPEVFVDGELLRVSRETSGETGGFEEKNPVFCECGANFAEESSIFAPDVSRETLRGEVGVCGVTVADRTACGALASDVALVDNVANCARGGGSTNCARDVDLKAEGAQAFQYELVAGERRLRAAKMLGLKRVPCIIVRVDDAVSAELALVENLLRENLNMFEQAEAFAHLAARYSLTQEEIAAKLSLSQSAIANKIRLLKLTVEERQLISESGLTERHARAFLRIGDSVLRENCIHHVINERLNVSETDKYIALMLAAPQEKLQKAEIVPPTSEKLCSNIYKFINRVQGTAGGMLTVNRRSDGNNVVITLTVRKGS